MRKHIRLLRYQFKQLRFGFSISKLGEKVIQGDETLYFALDWNHRIDEKYLDRFQQQCHQLEQSHEINIKNELQCIKWFDYYHDPQFNIRDRDSIIHKFCVCIS